jgi:hypothetical protein
VTGRFLSDRVFTERRAPLLAAQLPATDADAEARRDADAAALRAQIAKLDRQQNAQITALEDIDPDSPAAPAMRARIRDRFAELHTQRTEAETRLAALAAAKPRAADPAILDELPYCEDILNGLPPALKARLFAAIDLNILWNKAGGQVTVYATITDATLAFLADLLDPGQDGYHDTAVPAPTSNDMWALPQPPIGVPLPQPSAPSQPDDQLLARFVWSGWLVVLLGGMWQRRGQAAQRKCCQPAGPACGAPSTVTPAPPRTSPITRHRRGSGVPGGKAATSA